MKNFERVIVVVLDSVGAGEAHDAAEFGDVGSDTLGHIGKAVGGLNMPVMKSLGLGNIHEIEGVEPVTTPLANFGRMEEASVGKDTMTGHWEMMGLHIQERFITFTETGFPKELLDELTARTGHPIIGNKSASGTEILDELGEEHMATGAMIVYTSADSVLQIAAHEETFGLEELYRCCEIARELTMKPEWKVGRVIARPFVGAHSGAFKRTSNRHDYALKPIGKTALDFLKEAKYDVISVGKIVDIFDGEGITEYHKSKTSDHGMQQTIELMAKDFNGLMFVNLVDFDANWGHRRNPQGYAQELELFDRNLANLLPLLKDTDLLVLTADHGNDPTFTGTDHTREEVPLLVYSPSLKGNNELAKRLTFADLGATITDIFKTTMTTHGSSFLDELE